MKRTPPNDASGEGAKPGADDGAAPGGPASSGNPELDALAGAAAAADGAGQGEGEPGAPGPEPDAATMHREAGIGAIRMFVSMVTAYAPAAADIWPEATIKACGAALGAVAEKYNWSLTDIPPELAFLFVAGPPMYASSKIVAAQILANREAAAAAKAKPAGSGSTAGEPPGQARPTGAPEQAPGPAVHDQMGLYK